MRPTARSELCVSEGVQNHGDNQHERNWFGDLEFLSAQRIMQSSNESVSVSVNRSDTMKAVAAVI